MTVHASSQTPPPIKPSRATPLRCTCLVNNFNYQDYVVEAVDSALGQTRPFDEIIVVDDGSTDRSLEVLQRRFGTEPRVQILAKDNGGQLSCFNAGFRAATGDLLFFLDADDRYTAGYLAEALDFFAMYPDCGLLFCDFSRFGQEDAEVQGGEHSQLMGYSLIHTLCRRSWIGAPTSCLSLRRWVAERLLPLPLEEDWRIRADDCLLYGASLVGAKKGYLNRSLVQYRSHGNNHYHHAPDDVDRQYAHGVAVQRLFHWIMNQRCIDRDALMELTHREFRTHSEPTYKLFCQYMTIAWRSRISWDGRLRSMLAMCGHYVRTRRRQPTSRGARSIKLHPTLYREDQNSRRPISAFEAAPNPSPSPDESDFPKRTAA